MGDLHGAAEPQPNRLASRPSCLRGYCWAALLLQRREEREVARLVDPCVLESTMRIPRYLGSVGAGPVPALAGKTDATISRVTAQRRPRVAPLHSFFIRSGERQDHGNFYENTSFIH